MNGCLDHECDNCIECQSGFCCGEAVVDRNLPEQGSWHGELHVPLGELHERDGQLICHVCGQTYDYLYMHISVHAMDSATYRAYFGLRVAEPLMSERARAQRRKFSPPLAGKGIPPNLTTEQRREITTNREARLQSQKRGRHDPEQQRAYALLQSPKTEEQRIAVSRSKRKDDEGHYCPQCNAFICTWTTNPSRGGASSKRTLCGERSCLSEARRKAAAIANRKRWG